MKSVPTLTDQQRADARVKSLEVRRRRAAVKQLLRDGYSLQRAVTHPDGRGMRVLSLLMAIPGVGRATAERLMSAAGIPAGHTVARCGPRQLERLIGNDPSR